MKKAQSFFALVVLVLMGYTFLYWLTERPLVHITESGECVRVEVRGEVRPCPAILPMFYDSIIVMSEEEIKRLNAEEAQRKFEAQMAMRRRNSSG